MLSRFEATVKVHQKDWIMLVESRSYQRVQTCLDLLSLRKNSVIDNKSRLLPKLMIMIIEFRLLFSKRVK